MMIDRQVQALTKKLHAAQEHLISVLIHRHRDDDAARTYVQMAGERLDSATHAIRQLLELLDTAADASSENKTEHGGVL